MLLKVPTQTSHVRSKGGHLNFFFYGLISLSKKKKYHNFYPKTVLYQIDQLAARRAHFRPDFMNFKPILK